MGDESDSFFQTLFAGSITIFLGKLLGRGMSFISVVVIGRLLGPDGYGVIALGVTVITTISTLVLLGLHNGISRYLPRYDDVSGRRAAVGVSARHSRCHRRRRDCGSVRRTHCDTALR